MDDFKGFIHTQRPIATDTYEMVIGSPEAVKQDWIPGQFLHLEVPGRFLRRPISIAGVDTSAGTLTIIYRAVGVGTRSMAVMQPGQQVTFLWPLGRGYRVPETGRLLLVGGGLGVAPLLTMGQAFPDRRMDAVVGFKSAADVYGLEQLKRFCEHISLVTDDGSMGEKGFVTQYLPQGEYGAVLACGPVPMIKSLKSVNLPGPCQVSLEQRMACGVGACDGCACKVHRQDGYDHVRVCAEGPVFDLMEVDL